MQPAKADYVTLFHGTDFLPPETPADMLSIDDIVEVSIREADGYMPWQGRVTAIFKDDRFKVELIGDDGETYRYSVPRDLLRLVRRADA